MTLQEQGEDFSEEKIDMHQATQSAQRRDHDNGGQKAMRRDEAEEHGSGGRVALDIKHAADTRADT